MEDDTRLTIYRGTNYGVDFLWLGQYLRFTQHPTHVVRYARVMRARTLGKVRLGTEYRCGQAFFLIQREGIGMPSLHHFKTLLGGKLEILPWIILRRSTLNVQRASISGKTLFRLL